MRTLLLGSAMLLALSAPALAGSSSTDEIIPVVAPGEQIAIACDPLAVAQTNSDVRVVLTVSAMPGDPAPAYSKVLATQQKLGKGAISVKVPNMPEMADHTYDLDVYVVGDKNTQTCDAGQVKVTQQVSMVSEKPGGKHA